MLLIARKYRVCTGKKTYFKTKKFLFYGVSKEKKAILLQYFVKKVLENLIPLTSSVYDAVMHKMEKEDTLGSIY